MYKVTENRLEMAKPVLDEYVKQLEERGTFLASKFEHDLRTVWKTGYRSIKSAVIDLYQNHKKEYARIAEFYMRHQAPQGMMVSEFKHAIGVLDRSDLRISQVTLLGEVPVTSLEAHSIYQAEASGTASGTDSVVLVLGPDEFLKRLKPRRTASSA